MIGNSYKSILTNNNSKQLLFEISSPKLYGEEHYDKFINYSFIGRPITGFIGSSIPDYNDRGSINLLQNNSNLITGSYSSIIGGRKWY